MAQVDLEQSGDVLVDKVVDIHEENARHLVRAASLDSIPLLLRFGIVSHDYAKQLGIKLSTNVPTSQIQLKVSTGENGLDLISVFDPQQEGKKVSIKAVIETADALHKREGRFRHPAYVLIADRIRSSGQYYPLPANLKGQDTPSSDRGGREIHGEGSRFGVVFPFEAYISKRIDPGFIDGIVVEHDSLDASGTHYLDRIFSSPILSPMTWREMFASTPFNDEELDGLQQAFLANQNDLTGLLLTLATKNGFIQGKDRWSDFIAHLPHIKFPYPSSRMHTQTNPGQDFSFSVDDSKSLEEFKVTMQELAGKKDGRLDNKRLELMNAILEKRVQRYDVETKIWTTYFEHASGKPLARSNVGDILKGITGKSSIVLYDTAGNILN